MSTDSTATVVTNDLVLTSGGKIKNATAGAAAGESCTFEQLPFASFLEMGWTSNGNTTAVRFPLPSNSAALSSTLVSAELPTIAPGRIGMLVVNLPVAFATANTMTATAQINGVSTFITGTGNKNTTGLILSDSTHFASVNQGDLCNIAIQTDIADAGTSNGKALLGFQHSAVVVPQVPAALAAISGLVAWLDPFDATAMSVSGGNVDAITNKASGVVWRQTGTRPTFSATGINSLYPAWKGDGTAAWISTAEAAVVAATKPGQAYTLIYVMQAVSTTTYMAICSTANSAVAGKSSKNWGINSGTGFWTSRTISDAPTTVAHTSSQSSDALPHVFMFHGDGSHESIHIDNIVADPSLGADAPGTTTTNRFALFVNADNNPDSFYDGYLGELLIYNRELTAAERTTVYRYLTGPTRVAIAQSFRQPVIDPTIVDVIVGSGQSNMSGIAFTPPDFPAGLLHWPHDIGFTTPSVLTALGTHTGITSPPPEHGVELRLMAILANLGLTPFFFKVAQGGTSLQGTWLPPSASGWTTLVADWGTVLPLLQAQFPGCTFRYHYIWIQGENELALTSTDSQVTGYASNLEANFAALRSLLGVGTACQIHVIRLHDIGGAGGPATLAAMQAQQAAAVAATTNCHEYSSDAYALITSQLTHYSSAGFVQMAFDLATGILATIP